jgi:16S rRNA (guanine1207-N2)-methyltransferase
MSDNSVQQLLQFAATFTVPAVVVLDENAGSLPANPFADVRVISNRLDICSEASSKKWPSTFSDFVFDAASLQGIRLALYRISKEKRVVEHVLQSLWQLLPEGGELYCAGYKNEGIKTFAKRMQDAWSCEVTLERGEQQLHMYRLVKTGSAATALNSDDYHALQTIGDWNGMEVVSKPGIFAWDRFDDGSSFLLEHLPAFLQQTDHTRQSALDLGCGYGLLALALVQAGCKRVVATDNNAAAVIACDYNLQRHHGNCEVAVVTANCADTIKERFDLVVCNPPFHQGFSVENDLTDRFLQATKRLLTPRGRALFVVNTFIPLERKAAQHFAKVKDVARNGRFKLLQLQQAP